MKFRAWYADENVYTGSSVDDWKALPSEGVLWVTLFRPTGRTMYSGADWYYIDNGELCKVSSGEWGTWKPRPSGCLDCIKMGVGVSDEEFLRIKELAWSDNGDDL